MGSPSSQPPTIQPPPAEPPPKPPLKPIEPRIRPMDFMVPGILAKPGGQCDFNANKVSGKGLMGGYRSWQLYPNGNKISPVDKADLDPVTLADVDSLFLYREDGKYDLFLCEATTDYERGEIVEMSGPIQDHMTGRWYVQMHGRQSTLTTNFYKSASTNSQQGGAGGEVSIGGFPMPLGQYTLTVTVEHAGQVVFSTKTRI